jgi:hypothetical protein
VNLTIPDSSDFNSPVNSTSLFQNGGLVGGLFSECVNFQFFGGILNNVMAGELFSPGSQAPSLTFSAAKIASDGKSVSGGSYTASLNACGLTAPQTGTFTGYTVAPLNGTFTGTLTSNFIFSITQSSQPQVTMQIAQDSNFGITATGTYAQPGLTTNLAISPNPPNVWGALLQAANATATNVNGSNTFGVEAHFNPAGTQITIAFTRGAASETGTLTKQ